jgi:hypothetical protein
MMQRAESFINKKDNLLETIDRARKLIDKVKEVQKQYIIKQDNLKEEREALQREKEKMYDDFLARELKITKENYHLACSLLDLVR